MRTLAIVGATLSATAAIAYFAIGNIPAGAGFAAATCWALVVTNREASS